MREFAYILRSNSSKLSFFRRETIYEENAKKSNIINMKFATNFEAVKGNA